MQNRDVLINTIQNTIAEVRVLEHSFSATSEGAAVMAFVGSKCCLIVGGAFLPCFEGAITDTIKICPLSHNNRLVLNKYFPYTMPVSFGSKVPTFGFGDRLGFANVAQLKTVSNTGIMPVLAQQSMRELFLTSRTFSDVLDAATFSVFQLGWKKGFAFDGDHLKTREEVSSALDAGCSMITLDCSGVEKSSSSLLLSEREEKIATYVSDNTAKKLGLNFEHAELNQIIDTYTNSIKFITEVYFDEIHPHSRAIDFEISLDETDIPTTAKGLYYVANELKNGGVVFSNIAPRFIGEFQKAIDYIGDLAAFEIQLEEFVKISECFDFKLSFHSASEKFLTFPSISRLTKKIFHIKTSGTSWLEVLETIAKTDAGLYRRIHEKSLENFEKAKLYYHVKADPSKIYKLEEVEDSELCCYFEDEDARQMLHITYGFILEEMSLKDAILHFLQENRSLYEFEIEDLYKRHLDLLL